MCSVLAPEPGLLFTGGYKFDGEMRYQMAHQRGEDWEQNERRAEGPDAPEQAQQPVVNAAKEVRHDEGPDGALAAGCGSWCCLPENRAVLCR